MLDYCVKSGIYDAKNEYILSLNVDLLLRYQKMIGGEMKQGFITGCLGRFRPLLTKSRISWDFLLIICKREL